MLTRHILLWIFLSTSVIFLTTPIQAQTDEQELRNCIDKLMGQPIGQHLKKKNKKKAPKGSFVDLYAQFICSGKNPNLKYKTNAECILNNNGEGYTMSPSEATRACHPIYEMRNNADAKNCEENIKNANIPKPYKPFSCEYPYVREHSKDFVQCMNSGEAKTLSIDKKFNLCIKSPVKTQVDVHARPAATPATTVVSNAGSAPKAAPDATPRDLGTAVETAPAATPPDLGTASDAAPTATPPDLGTTVKAQPATPTAIPVVQNAGPTAVTRPAAPIPPATSDAGGDDMDCFYMVKNELIPGTNKKYLPEHAQLICKDNYRCILNLVRKKENPFSTKAALKTCHATYAMRSPKGIKWCLRAIEKAKLSLEYKHYACELKGVKNDPISFVKCINDIPKLTDTGKMLRCKPSDNTPVRTISVPNAPRSPQVK